MSKLMHNVRAYSPLFDFCRFTTTLIQH